MLISLVPCTNMNFSLLNSGGNWLLILLQVIKTIITKDIRKVYVIDRIVSTAE